VLSVALGIALAEIALRPGRALPADARTWAPRTLPDGTHVETVRRSAADGVQLSAWLFTPPGDVRASVLVAHGVAGSREHSRALGTLLARNGFVVLAPDARGHGESGGLASYGVVERGDVREWAAWLAARRASTCLFGIGASMGAAQLLQAAKDERLFCGVIAESSFASFREVAFDRIGWPLGLGDWLGRWPGRLAVETGFLYARLRYGLNLGEASPVDAVRSTGARILLIHGTDDRNIPVRHAHMIAGANARRVELWTVAGAGHTSAWAMAPREFETRVLGFLAAAEPR
jgi:alpha-beta hydrolase superfamily lysophospholipase